MTVALVKTAFSGAEVIRTSQERSRAEGLDASRVFALVAQERASGINTVGYTSDPDIANEWQKAGALPPGRTDTYVPALTRDHIQPAI